MFGFGNKNTFEIDGVEFTIDGRVSSAFKGGRGIYCNGELVQKVPTRMTVVDTELTVNGTTYSVFLTFDSGNLSKAHAIEKSDQ
jgi:hypothetical protein